MIRKTLYRWILPLIVLLQFGFVSPYAFADELVDNIAVHEEANGDTIAIIKFAYPIQYLRYFPRVDSAYTSIYFNILGGIPPDVWQDYESHRTPPSDLIKDITVSTKDRATGPKVEIKLFRPATFSVRMGSNSQILLVLVRPTGPAQKKNEGKPAVEQSGAVPPVVPPTAAPAPVKKPAPAEAPVVAAPLAAVPVPPVPKAAAPTAPATAAPAKAAPVAAAPVQPPAAIVETLSDRVVENISVHPLANGDVDAEVVFRLPIRYLRHYPRGKTPYSDIYFDFLRGVPASKWQDYESHRTIPSELIRDITVSTRDQSTGPKVLIRFHRPEKFSVKMGRNDRILLVHIMPGVQQKNEGQTATGGALVPSLALPAAALPALTAPTPSIPTAAAPVAAAPVAAAPVAAAPVAAAPVETAPVETAPVAPAGEVTRPNIVLAPSRSRRIRIPLGGKNGLPPFPEIEYVVPEKNAAAPEKSSLAEKVAQADNQAAALMEKGGNDLLAGKLIPAIEAFNEVLQLPPNRYSEDAQLWIGIAKEMSGQTLKAILEFNAYLRFYPGGKSAPWVKQRLALLKRISPAYFAELEKPLQPPAAVKGAAVPLKVQNTEFHYSEFGSLSMYYYTGASQTTTTAAAGTVQAPTSFSVTDQKSLVTNVNMTARGYNNEYDNRLVFQDFYAANFLPGQQNINRLGAAYYELNDRIADYSLKVGRQSGIGGGVMGRFDGATAGYGFSPGWRINAAAGQLSDFTIDSKPKFNSISLDFGVRNPFGGSAYFINQTANGITDRRAVGGNLRYFDQRFTLLSMLDYDLQFKALNIFTVQGTLNGGGTGTDYNFLIDRRRSPILDIRNAVNGTTSSIATLLQAGWTTSDLVLLADQRTTTSSTAQVGMTNHLSDKWNIGTDFTIAKTAGMAASGTLLPDGTTGVEGFVPATPSTGNTWTISERLTGLGVFKPRDVTNFSVSYTKGELSKTEAFQFSNHQDLADKWTLDSTFHMSFQTDSVGGKSNDYSPTLRGSYQIRNNLATDIELGLDWANTSSSVLQSSSKSLRKFASYGFRLNF